MEKRNKDCRENLLLKRNNEKLIDRICEEILNYLGKDSGFYAKKTAYSCVQVSKKNWLNMETKGLHYEVWCKNIGDRDLLGCEDAEFWIGLHIEGRNVYINRVISELEKAGVSKTFRYIVEQRKLILSFEDEKSINESICRISEEVKRLDDKYTEKIDWAFSRI